MNIIFFIDSFYLDSVKYYNFVVIKKSIITSCYPSYCATSFNEYRFQYYSDVY